MIVIVIVTMHVIMFVVLIMPMVVIHTEALQLERF